MVHPLHLSTASRIRPQGKPPLAPAGYTSGGSLPYHLTRAAFCFVYTLACCPAHCPPDRRPARGVSGLVTVQGSVYTKLLFMYTLAYARRSVQQPRVYNFFLFLYTLACPCSACSRRRTHIPFVYTLACLFFASFFMPFFLYTVVCTQFDSSCIQ